MKKLLFLIALLLIHVSSFAQFNQKLSINISPGLFKTFGEKYTEAGFAMQFPNYQPGLAAMAGIQVSFTERFSLVAELGLLLTNGWDYRANPGDDPYLYWAVYDPETDVLLEEGENCLDFRNYSLEIKPKLYLLKVSKLNPYLMAGLNINITRCWFENNYWYAQKELGLIPPEETEPWNDNLLENMGIGFNPGLGLEFTQGKRIHIYLETGYYFISLHEANFTDPSRVENFNAFIISSGIRFNFLKSKDL